MADQRASMERYAPSERMTKRQPRRNPYILGLGSLASLGGFLIGYVQGVVSGVLTMGSFAAKYPRVHNDSSCKGWFVSTLLLSAWLGSLLNGAMADRVGRKWSTLVAVAIFTAGSALQAGAGSVPILFAGRAIAGLAVGMLTIGVPMYTSEVSTPAIRGTLVKLQQLNVALGILVSYWLEYGTQYISGEASWRVPLALQILPALILGLVMLLCPESPRWYCMRGQEDRALLALARIRRADVESEDLCREYLTVKAEVLYEKSFGRDRHAGKTGVSLCLAQYASLISNWPSFRRLAICCGIVFLQQFMGAAAFIYYAPAIFGQLGLTRTPTSLLATGVYGVVNTFSTLPTLFLVDMVGRRPLLLCGAFGMCISLLVVGGVIGGHGSSLIEPKVAGWIGIVFVYIYNINFSYSFAPIGSVMPSEIFTLADRSKATSVMTSAMWMCNFVVGLVTPRMLDSIGYEAYVFFAAFCLLAFGFTYFLVPETRGKSLEDMDAVFGDNAAHNEKKKLSNIAAELEIELIWSEKGDEIKIIISEA